MKTKIRTRVGHETKPPLTPNSPTATAFPFRLNPRDPYGKTAVFWRSFGSLFERLLAFCLSTQSIRPRAYANGHAAVVIITRQCVLANRKPTACVFAAH